MTNDGVSFSERQKIVFGFWLLIKFLLALAMGKQVTSFMIDHFSSHAIQNDLYRGLEDMLTGAIVFVVFSDMCNFYTVRRLKIPGSAFRRLMLLSFLDFLMAPLAALLPVIYNNLQHGEKSLASGIMDPLGFCIWVVLKNLIFVFFVKKSHTVDN
jgi:hypothetical protein